MIVDIVFVDEEGEEYALDKSYGGLDDAAQAVKSGQAVSDFTSQHCRGQAIRISGLRLVLRKPLECGPAEE